MKDTPDVDTEGNITYRPVAEISRITCEVVGNTICQSRGNLNAVPNKSQVALIERWARDRGLGIGNLRGW